MKLCTFRVGDLLCAVAADEVREVVRVGTITPVPGAPEHVAGLVNLRGRVLCAVDAAGRLGCASDRTFALVVWHHGRLVAVLADAIADIGPVNGTRQAPPPAPDNAAAALIASVIDSPAGTVHLLDLVEVIGQ